MCLTAGWLSRSLLSVLIGKHFSCDKLKCLLGLQGLQFRRYSDENGWDRQSSTSENSRSQYCVTRHVCPLHKIPCCSLNANISFRWQRISWYWMMIRWKYYDGDDWLILTLGLFNNVTSSTKIKYRPVSWNEQRIIKKFIFVYYWIKVRLVF